MRGGCRIRPSRPRGGDTAAQAREEDRRVSGARSPPARSSRHSASKKRERRRAAMSLSRGRPLPLRGRERHPRTTLRPRRRTATPTPSPPSEVLDERRRAAAQERAALDLGGLLRDRRDRDRGGLRVRVCWGRAGGTTAGGGRLPNARRLRRRAVDARSCRPSRRAVSSTLSGSVVAHSRVVGSSAILREQPRARSRHAPSRSLGRSRAARRADRSGDGPTHSLDRTHGRSYGPVCLYLLGLPMYLIALFKVAFHERISFRACVRVRPSSGGKAARGASPVARRPLTRMRRLRLVV